MFKKGMVILISSVLVSSTFALTPKDDKGVITLKSNEIAWESPDRFSPYTISDAPTDIDYWKALLPFEDDQDEDMYIVLPTLGLISPVVFVPEGSQDFTDMTQGREIDINKYLNNGVMHYANSGLPGEVGNPVIFGHSNFFKNRPGNYKSIFADIMNLDVGVQDEIWIYQKESSGEYDLKKFEITESYETVPTDVEILRPKGGKELTVFACTNGLAGRWILRGRYIEDDEILVPYAMKQRMYDISNQLATHPNKQKIVVEGMKKITELRNSLGPSQGYEDKLRKYVLNYIEKELVIVY